MGGKVEVSVTILMERYNIWYLGTDDHLFSINFVKKRFTRKILCLCSRRQSTLLVQSYFAKSTIRVQ